MPVTSLGKAQSAAPGINRNQTQKESSRTLPETNYERWQGRVVSGINKLGSTLVGIFQSGPKDEDAHRVYESFRHSGHKHCYDDFHRSLYDYQIASAMQLHGVARISERNVEDTAQLVIAAGSTTSSKKTLEKLQKTLSLSPTELAYRFIAKGKTFPPGFLSRALTPYMVERMTEEYGLGYDLAERAVSILVKRVGLNKEADITFERILELKNAIRWQFGPAPSELNDVPPMPEQAKPINPANPALSAPKLAKPGKSRYYLDVEDRKHIQNVVDKGGSIKIPKHDLFNRLKRMVLRNKQNLFLNGMGVVISTVLSSVASGGIAAGVNLLIYMGWFTAWTGGSEAIRMVRVIRAMQKMEKTADFALNPTDMEAFKGFDEKKFRSFMKCCRYVCSHETLTRIYNDYAELEKDAETRLKMPGVPKSISEAIELEEGNARFSYRKKNLHESFDLFRRLYTGAIGDIRRMEDEWNKDVQELWEYKFKNMSPSERNRLFNRAANDTRVIGKTYHFSTDQTDWLKEIFPQMADEKEWNEIELEGIARKSRDIAQQELKSDQLSEEDKETINRQTDKVANAVYLMKRGIFGYTSGWVKSAFRSTVAHGFKIGWHGVRNTPFLEVTPQLPKLSVDGLIIFGFFFLSNLFMDQANTAWNSHRLKQIQKNKKGKTGLPVRDRTGREEIATLRKLSKDQLGKFIDNLMSLHDAHKKIMQEVEYYKHLNVVDPYSLPYSHMDAYEAAVLILRRKYYEEIVAKMASGAIGQFYDNVQNKTKALDGRISQAIILETQ